MKLVTDFKLVLILAAAGLFQLNNFNSYAQSADLARLEFTYFPQSDSKNSFRRTRAFINYPIKLGKEGSYLVPGLDYENIHFKYHDPAPFEKGEDLDRYQSFKVAMGYTFKINERWRFAAQGGVLLASNFEEGTVINDDLLYTGGALFIKEGGEEVEKPWRLMFGLYYSTTSGWPFPLPVVNYYKEFQPDWSYTIGVPKSNIVYEASKRSHFQVFATLDGFFANIQDNRPLRNSDKVAENISMTIILAGIGYEFNFTEHFVYYLYGGYTVMNDIRMRDHRRDDVYDINKGNSFYGRTGLKLKI